MKSIKQFLMDESGSSEAASSVILIMGVGGFLLLAVIAYYTAMNGLFTKAAGWINTHTGTSWN